MKNQSELSPVGEDLIWNVTFFVFLKPETQLTNVIRFDKPSPFDIDITADQGGRSWQSFSEGKNGHKNFRQARIYYFRDNKTIAT